MSQAATHKADIRASERKFYTRMAIALVALVILGFGPSFYLRGIVPAYPRPNPTLPPSVLIHGALFSLWMLLFVAQTQLIATRRTHIHMKLGIGSVLVGLALVPVMYLASVWQVARANQPPFTDPLTWTIVPLSVIPVFAYLMWSGWKHRRESQWHKRLMLSAAIIIVMGPTIGRLPIAPPTLVGFTIILLLGLLLFLPLMLWDRRTLGHLHPATRRGFALGVLTVAIPLIVFWTGLDWASIARHLPGVG